MSFKFFELSAGDWIYKYSSFGHGYPWAHWQDSLEIHMFLKDGFVILDSVRYEVPAGSFVAINPYVMHSIDKYRENEGFFCTLIVNSDFLMENGIDFRKIQLEPVFADEECSRIYKSILASDENEPHGDTEIRGKVLLFVSMLARKHSVTDSEKISKVNIIPALIYIKDNLDKKISLDSLAELCNMSKCYFTRIFKQKTGYTVVQCINVLRCSKAHLLMKSKGYSVSRAARECGFDNMSYFSKTFKKIIGHLPRNNKTAGGDSLNSHTT